MMIKTVLAKLSRPSNLAALAGFAILVDILYCKALGAVGAPGKAALVTMLMVVAILGALVMLAMLDRGYDAVIARCRGPKP